MRVALRSLAILLICLALVPIAQADTLVVQEVVEPEVAVTSDEVVVQEVAEPELVVTGDELVIITSDGRLSVRDPFTPTGITPVVWQSPETGFTRVATGDFNGDGTSEIVGLRGGEAIVYDPVLRPGEPNTAHTFLATAGQVWRNVTTGDLDGDGRDELVLAQSSGSGTQMYAHKFITNSGWMQTFTAFYAAPWVELATGDVMGNGRDQVVGIRNVGSTCQIIIFNPANNWQTVNEFTRDFPWVALAIGDVTLDGANKDEIVVTRTGVGAELPSMFVFRWEAQFPDLQDQEREVFNPHFSWVALADVNGSGDDELFMLRNNQASGQAALTSRNYGVDQGTPVFNELIGQTQWNGIQAADVDGDGRYEVVVMSPSAYLIYDQPNVNTAFTTYPGAYSITGSFAVGNFDGEGTLAGPNMVLSPTSISLLLQPGQGASVPVSITNAGTDTFTWVATVGPGTDWLTIAPANGTVPAIMQVQIDTSSLAVGQHTGEVTVVASGGTLGSPQILTVRIWVGGESTYLPLIFRR